MFMKVTAGFVLLASPGGILAAQSVPTAAPSPVPYPEGYRSWSHVKSTVISPAHANFSTTGGFQHIYANVLAMTGYRTRVFPEGSIVVFDWLEMRENSGAFAEGPRRQIDVMVKDSVRYGATGGWGFQRFVKDSKTELAATPAPAQCFACHVTRKQDGLVLSTYRP
jgi:Cytochrome P460